jgi:hypothetical protein
MAQITQLTTEGLPCPTHLTLFLSPESKPGPSLLPLLPFCCHRHLTESLGPEAWEKDGGECLDTGLG